MICLNLIVATIMVQKVLETIFLSKSPKINKICLLVMICIYFVYFWLANSFFFGLNKYLGKDELIITDDPILISRRPQLMIIAWVLYPMITSPFIPILHFLYSYNRRKIVKENFCLSLKLSYRVNVNTLRQTLKIMVILGFISSIGILCALVLLYKIYVKKEKTVSYEMIALINVSEYEK